MLFDCFPKLESERLILREWTVKDAAALNEIIHDAVVYRYLPSFLYEQSIPDTAEMIAGNRHACFDKKESVLFGICLKDTPDAVIALQRYTTMNRKKKRLRWLSTEPKILGAGERK